MKDSRKNRREILPENIPEDFSSADMTEEIILHFTDDAEIQRLPESPASPPPPAPEPRPSAQPEAAKDALSPAGQGDEAPETPTGEPEAPEPRSDAPPEAVEPPLPPAGQAPEAPDSHPGTAPEATDPPEGPAAFYASLIALRAADIAPKKKSSPGELLRFLVRPAALLLFGAVFFYAAYTVVFNVVTYRIADERYQQLAGNFSLEGGGSRPLLYTDDAVLLPDFEAMLSGDFVYKDVVVPEDGAGTAVYRARLAMLKEQNPDTFGWIMVDGTNINYPIVQGADNDFYLDHDFSGAYYTVGSIFVDYRCTEGAGKDPNLVIYGHNIRTRGIMFNQLLRYTDRNFFYDHPEIKIYTPDGLYLFEVFSFFQTTADAGYARVYFDGDEDFVAYCKGLRDSSWYPREGIADESFTPETRLLTLSTCTNGDASERYAVVARLKEIRGEKR